MKRKDAGNERLQHYLEKWGMVFAQLGATRMAGRIIGWLLICDPSHQSAKQIANATGASLASVSVATRTLTQAAIIERFGMPGERTVFFRLAPGTWMRLMRFRLVQISGMTALAEEGLRIRQGAGEATKSRLREIHSYCSFMDREMPALLERWKKEWQREQRALGKKGA